MALKYGSENHEGSARWEGHSPCVCVLWQVQLTIQATSGLKPCFLDQRLLEQTCLKFLSFVYYMLKYNTI